LKLTAYYFKLSADQGKYSRSIQLCSLPRKWSRHGNEFNISRTVLQIRRAGRCCTRGLISESPPHDRRSTAICCACPVSHNRCRSEKHARSLESPGVMRIRPKLTNQPHPRSALC
jgi:hypothetical protein